MNLKKNCENLLKRNYNIHIKKLVNKNLIKIKMNLKKNCENLLKRNYNIHIKKLVNKNLIKIRII